MKTIILLIFSIIAFSSCSKKNEFPIQNPDTITGQDEIQAGYPHPITWKAQHMGYMANKAVESTCLQCHTKNLGAPLKVSCATSCHKTDAETLPPKETPSPVANKCTACHSVVTENKFGHYPANAGLCTTCHTVSEKHLNDGSDPTQTKTSANDCYRCHTRQDKEVNVHTALKMDENSCITCHNPHGGNQRFFLQDMMTKDKDVTIKALCTQCHTTDLDQMATKHGAIENQRSCLNCHNPHSSKNYKQLKLPVKQLCLSCHDKPMDATLSEARVIPNIKAIVDRSKKSMGKCTDCHNAHGSAFKRILTENFSTDNYNEYPPKAGAPNPYALCFQCHDEESLLNKDDISGTEFRSAEKNLHWKHVVEEQPGKSCKVCHDPHGSSQDVFVRESFKMGTVDIPVIFTKTATGGSCVTCHADGRAYNR